MDWHTKRGRARAQNNGVPPCSDEHILLAVTWYAQSKKAVCLLVFISLLSSAHWSCVGSIPVGLCAHACSKKTDSSSAASTSESRPTKMEVNESTGTRRVVTKKRRRVGHALSNNMKENSPEGSTPNYSKHAQL